MTTHALNYSLVTVVIAGLASACGTDRLLSTARPEPDTRAPAPALDEPQGPVAEPPTPEEPGASPIAVSLEPGNPLVIPEGTGGLPARRVGVAVVLERPASTTVSVTLEVCAAASSCNALYGADFLLGASFGTASPWRTTLVFPAGTTRQSATLFVVDDAVRDGDRTLTLELREPSAPAVLGVASQSLTLMDDDPQQPVLSFSSGNPTVIRESEIGANFGARFTLHLERHGDARNIIVLLTVCGVGTACTAAQGVDFGTLAMGLNFQGVGFMNGATEAEIVLPMFNDDVVDGDRTLVLALSTPTAPASIAGGPLHVALIDDEQDVGPVFDFSSSNTTSLNEAYAPELGNRALPVVVQLDRRGFGGDVAVQLDVCAQGSGCTTVGGVDYQLDTSYAPYSTLFFPPGVSSATAHVHIVNDRVRDGAKRLTLRLMNQSPGTRVRASVLVVDITDDESPALDGYVFRYTHTHAPESAGDGIGAVVVDRNVPEPMLQQAGLVEVRVDGSATSAEQGIDFSIEDARTPLVGSPLTATVLFPAGVRSRRFVVQTAPDSLADGDKHIVLRLANPQGGGLGVLSTTELNLVDRESLTVGLDGREIATLELAEVAFPNGNRCDWNTTAAGGTGPCGASPVPVADCGEDMVDPITNAWLLDVDPHVLAGNTLHVPIRPQHVLSLRFRTAPANRPATYMLTTDEAAPAVGPPVRTFTSVSAARCDFDRAKFEAGHTCFQVGAPNAKWAVTGSAADEGVLTYCMLQPDAEYYFNIRMDGGTGVDQCLALQRAGDLPAGACGVLVAAFGYDLR